MTGMLVEAVRYKETLNIQSDYFYSLQKPNFKIRLSPTGRRNINMCTAAFMCCTSIGALLEACQEENPIE